MYSCTPWWWLFGTGTVTKGEHVWCPKVQFQHVQKKPFGEYCEALLTVAVQQARTVILASEYTMIWLSTDQVKRRQEEPTLTLGCLFVSQSTLVPSIPLDTHHHLQ